MNNSDTISIVVPCYNEEGNVASLYREICNVMKGGYAHYKFECIFIDNASTDNTEQVLRKIAAKDKRLKIVINTRNFGHLRSPYYAVLQAKGDCIILLAADFQDPPSLIGDFIHSWESGEKIFIGIKNISKENRLMFLIRKSYYSLIEKYSDIEHISNFTGFGLYDKSVINMIRSLDEPYPYFRGLIAETGVQYKKIFFTQPKRSKGKTKNNIYTLFDIAMLGFVNYSKVPLRLSIITGFIVSLLSLLVAFAYLIYKILFWDSFQLGLAPLIIGMFLFASMQLIFIGVIGEYVGSIYTQIKNKPLVYVKERVNFDD